MKYSKTVFKANLELLFVGIFLMGGGWGVSSPEGFIKVFPEQGYKFEPGNSNIC